MEADHRWEFRVEADWTQSAPVTANGWHPVQPWGAGATVLLQPGTYRWLTEFESGETPSEVLEFLGIANAEIAVFLNGRHLGVYPAVRPAGTAKCGSFNAIFDLSNALQPGRNRLAVELYFPGRHNSGQPVFAGFSQPAVLRSSQREMVPLPEWRVSPQDGRKWSSGELDAAPAPAQPGFDCCAWETVDLSRPNQHRRPADLAAWHEVRWYRQRMQIPLARQGRPLFLECPPVEEAWAYADGRCLGRAYAASSTTFDLSAFTDRAEIEVVLAVRHNWYFFNACWGLEGAPRLVLVERVLDGPWYMAAGTAGEHHGWSAAAVGWGPAPTVPVLPPGRLWVRRSVAVTIPEGVSAPLYVELAGNWQTHATVYWNGQPAGIYAAVGPEKRFYIPEHRVQPHNLIVVAVNGYAVPAACGEIRVGAYSLMHKLTVQLCG